MTTLDEIQARHDRMSSTYRDGCSCCKSSPAHVDRGKLIAALRAVEAVHEKGSGHNPLCSCGIPAGAGATCKGCGEDYPCPTITAIWDALG